MPAQVLVVDQNPLVQTTIENSLNSQNCEVTSVRDALSGLDLAYKIKPDLMIADLRMEGLMVYSFCARVKQKSFLSHIPIFLLVQQNDVYDENRLRQSGVAGFIQKPVDPAKLKEALSSFLPQFSIAPLPAAASSSVSAPSSPAVKMDANEAAPFSEKSDQKGEEFNMDQTVFDRTMVETKTDRSLIKPEETVKIDDLMDWAQPEVSPFSEVISSPAEIDSSEVTQLADVTQLMGESALAAPLPPEDFSEVTQFADVTQMSHRTDETAGLSGVSPPAEEKYEEKFESDFLKEPMPEPVSRMELQGTKGIEADQQKPSDRIDEIKSPGAVPPKEAFSEIKETTRTSSTNGRSSRPVLMPPGDNLQITKAAEEIIEKVAWEIVPYLAEQALKKELITAIIEKIIWEVVPPIAEQAVKEAIQRISEEQEHSPS